MGKKGFYWFLFTSGFLLVMVGAYTVFRLKSLGAFTEIEDQIPYQVKVVAEVPGPEALQVDHQQGKLYFISNNPCSQSFQRGGIYSLDLKSENVHAIPFQFDQPNDFHPHGLSFYRNEHGRPFLFTNNHREDGTHSVEIFEIRDFDQLLHLKTITGFELTSPNDLVAVGSEQFYLTNDGRSHDRAARSVDTFLGRKTGNVLYYNGNSFKTIVDNLYFPNGVAFDHHSKTLMVGETLSGNLITYRLDENRNIQRVDNLFISIGIDNLFQDETGNILVAAHPNLFALSQHMKNVDNSSPSQVFKVDSRTEGLDVIYEHTGSQISGVSAVVAYKNDFYLGAVCDDKVLRLTIGD